MAFPSHLLLTDAMRLSNPQTRWSLFLTLTTVEWSDALIQSIHNNPVEAGLFARPEEYFFSSAQDYSGQKGTVKVS